MLLIAAPALAQDIDLTDYARARAADAAGASDLAAAGYARALAAMPDDQLLAMRAYRQALAAGDYALASRAAAALVRAKAAPSDTDILAFAIALQGGDRLGAEKAIERLSGGPLDFMAPILGAWLALDRGEDPLPLLDTARGNALGARYAERHRSLLLIARGQADQGLLALSTRIGTDDSSDERIDIGLALLRAGDEKRARSIFTDFAGASDAWRRRAARAGKPDAAFGASRLFLGLAGDVSHENLIPLSILLTRAALLLDPQEDRARLLLADALSRSGSTELALATLAAIRADGPFARAAASEQVIALRRIGRVPEALARAKALADASDASRAELRGYGDALAEAGRYGDAAAAYGRALARAEGKDWQLLYLQGAALDRAGRWAEALPALRKAVELAPEEASALTYLGYAQVMRGEDLSGAQALLERARKLKPDDAVIADSLAWAYFTRGDPARALPLLEEASRGDPGGTRVNEHLGDAYWRLGRRIEARYAWRAAEVGADADDLARLQGKLANGLN